ncbi:hypothetical protein JN06_02729 [Bacteroides zoogleoformans]|nr:hypothetical protein JN06_02729 [Bacteroides zoogleoformans]
MRSCIKIIRNVLKIVHDQSLPLWQSYTRTLKGIYRARRFGNHPKNRKKALKADRQLKTIAGRLVRELERNLGGRNGYEKIFELYTGFFLRTVSQKIKYILCMNRTWFVSIKARNIRNTSLVIRYPFFAHGQGLFLLHALLGMNTMGIPYKRRWNKPKG